MTTQNEGEYLQEMNSVWETQADGHDFYPEEEECPTREEALAFAEMMIPIKLDEEMRDGHFRSAYRLREKWETDPTYREKCLRQCVDYICEGQGIKQGNNLKIKKPLDKE